MAQDDSSLRNLAERNGIYIGAAAYTNHLRTPGHADVLSREFNMLTPENEAKACQLQGSRGQFTFQKLDELVAFAEQNDMVLRGHTLLWHQCELRWMENNDSYTREQASAEMRDHIYTVVGRYRGRIAMWDVVNEAFDGAARRDTVWQRLIGDDYIELAFQFAHDADPDALLFYNDYGAEQLNAKSDAIYEMAADFVARGIPIDGIGLQSHFTVGGIAFRSISNNIQRIGELGLQVHMTEADIRFDGEPSEAILERQANDYRDLMAVCLDHENCTAFIVWGVTDRLTWLRNSNLGFFNNPDVEPLLFDDEYQPKPAYYALRDLLTGVDGG
jgi:endo-1,4-beta-xylanase